MLRLFSFTAALLLAFSGVAFAHFGMVIPSASTVSGQNGVAITLDLSFSHPMALGGMNLEKPESVKVFSDGKVEDLTAKLQTSSILGHDGWVLSYAFKRPGVYQFVMTPAPYWEAAEDRFIIHYTKTYVAAFGGEDGWDEPAGLKTEIVPLTRPFGNYVGNVFQGRVLLDGKPVPGAEVEVEFYNRDGQYAAPDDYFVTQTVRADERGVFTYGIPFAGWWGFAALSMSKDSLEHDGAAKPVELGAVLWAEFLAPVRKE